MEAAIKRRSHHLAEMLLRVKLRGKDDPFRKRHPFSEDMEATHAILFNPKYSKRKKIHAYRSWLETAPNQPCVFGKIAAKNKSVFVCLLEEDEILRMRYGDADLRETIQDHRQVWKRYALDGLASSFVILLLSKSLVTKEADDCLKEICRRLMELYMEVEILDDSFQTQREYVFLRQVTEGKHARLLKFSTLPNIFCAQGDGRWWRDHRTPGGIMITSNALGHFMYSRTKKLSLEGEPKIWALENAMRTIHNAYQGTSQGRPPKFKNCPATFLLPLAPGEISPLKPSSLLASFSADHYQGYFHTDHLIPSIFFQTKQNSAEFKVHDNLTLRYIYDPASGAEEHAELMTGVEATWYDVKRNMDHLPDFADPEKTGPMSAVSRDHLARWLKNRLAGRLQ